MVRIAFLLCVTLVSIGCRSVEQSSATTGTEHLRLRPSFEDQTPSHLPSGALDGVVLLQNEDETLIASGIGVDERRLLTALHFVERLESKAKRRWVDPRLRVLIDGELLEANVVARGDRSVPHGDWALLEFAERHWPRIVSIHAPALDPEWAPPANQELLLVGYAKGFYRAPTDGPDAPLSIESDGPTPSVVVRMIRPERHAWIAHGDPLWLEGMSGGGAMIWNGERGEAELVGLVPGDPAATVITYETRRFLGIPLSTQTTSSPIIVFQVHRLPPDVIDD